jgi:hypothetical protein
MWLPPHGFGAKFKTAGNGEATSKLFETVAEVGELAENCLSKLRTLR